MRGSTLALVAAGTFMMLAFGARFRAEAPLVPRPALGPVLMEGDRLPGIWSELELEAAPDGLILVTVFGTDCSWSRYSVSALNRVRSEVEGRALARTVAVSVSDRESTIAFPSETGFEYRVVSLSGQTVFSRWRVPAVPYTMYLDEAGVVLGAWRGHVDHAVAGEIVAFAEDRASRR